MGFNMDFGILESTGIQFNAVEFQLSQLVYWPSSFQFTGTGISVYKNGWRHGHTHTYIHTYTHTYKHVYFSPKPMSYKSYT